MRKLFTFFVALCVTSLWAETVTWEGMELNMINLEDGWENTYSNQGVTLRVNTGSVESGRYFSSGNYTFSSEEGTFSRIEIMAGYGNTNGDGWQYLGPPFVWEGSASEVSFNGSLGDVGRIVFTLGSGSSSSCGVNTI